MTRSLSSTSKSHLFVNLVVDTIIKHHASTSSKEIYGWLLGTEFPNGDSYIWVAIPCVKYTHQSEIGALPDPIEFQDVSAVLPEGMGIIGIYHSHPNRIFHSSTDNATLARFSALYPKMISAVTNPFPVSKDAENATRWYSLDKNKESVHEISVEFKSIADGRFKFSRWSASWEVQITSINPISSPNQLVPILMPLCLDFMKGSEVSFNDILENESKKKKISDRRQAFNSVNSKRWKKAMQNDWITNITLPPFSKEILDRDKGAQGPNSKSHWEYSVNLKLQGTLLVDTSNFPTAEEIEHRINLAFQSQLSDTLSRSVFIPLRQNAPLNFTIISEDAIEFDYFKIPLDFGLFSQVPNDIFANIASPDSMSSSLPGEWNTVIERSKDEYVRLYQNQTARLENFRERLGLLDHVIFEDLIQPLDSAVSQILANRGKY
ncbi:MAG: Mov34/MPN/PAD-1 family protein [Promethearchaeota archaeon]